MHVEINLLPWQNLVTNLEFSGINRHCLCFIHKLGIREYDYDVRLIQKNGSDQVIGRSVESTFQDAVEACIKAVEASHPLGGYLWK